MPGNLNPQQISFFIILIVGLGLLVTERLRNDLVALLVILALVVTGVLGPREALAGFGSEPAVVVAAIFVLSGALHQTGLSESFGQWIGRWAGRGYGRALMVIMPSGALLSAVPIPDPALEASRERVVLRGEVPSPLNPPSGCVFHPRCPIAVDRCRDDIPLLRTLGRDHEAACHLA